MSKTEVKLILEETDKNRVLLVRKADGTEYYIDIFSGGGYYDALWLQTKEEIEENAQIRKENDQKFYDSREASRIETKKHWWSKS